MLHQQILCPQMLHQQILHDKFCVSKCCINKFCVNTCCMKILSKNKFCWWQLCCDTLFQCDCGESHHLQGWFFKWWQWSTLNCECGWSTAVATLASEPNAGGTFNMARSVAHSPWFLHLMVKMWSLLLPVSSLSSVPSTTSRRGIKCLTWALFPLPGAAVRWELQTRFAWCPALPCPG